MASQSPWSLNQCFFLTGSRWASVSTIRSCPASLSLDLLGNSFVLNANPFLRHKEMPRQNPKLYLQQNPCYFSTLATDSIKVKWLLSFSAWMASFFIALGRKMWWHQPKIIKPEHLTKDAVSLELHYNFRFGVLPLCKSPEIYSCTCKVKHEAELLDK